MTEYEELSTAELDELVGAGRISLDDYWTARVAIDSREQAELHEAAFDLPAAMPAPVATTATTSPPTPAAPATPVNWVQPPPRPTGGPVSYEVSPADPIASAPPARGPQPNQWGAPGRTLEGLIDLDVVAPAQDAQPTRAGRSRRARRLPWLSRPRRPRRPR